MTELLELYMKTIRNLKKNSYKQENSIYEQIIKRINKRKQDTLLQNNCIPFKVE